jgi:putative iron-only hydrogenase system regulator
MEDTEIYKYYVYNCVFKTQFFLCIGGNKVETRVAIIGIIVQNEDSVELLNKVLHEYGKYIIGRMGIPYRTKSINIISIAVDAPQDIISALSGKIGKLQGISSKTAYSSIITKE